MAIYVNTNVSSLNGQRRLANATNSLNTTYQRLSSGLRINSAKDDAAGLQISNRLTSQINGLNQGNRNANDGIALAQTAEGAMEEMTSMIQRIRTLAIQSANGTNTQADRDSLQKEVLALNDELTRISVKTTFNGEQILAGKDSGSSLLDSRGRVNFQVGAYAYDTLSVDLSDGFSVTQMSKTVFSDWSEPIGLEIVDKANDPEYQGMSDDDIIALGKIDITFAQSIVKGTVDGSNPVGSTGADTNSAFVDSTGAALAGNFFDTAQNPVGKSVYLDKAAIDEVLLSASKEGDGTQTSDSARVLVKALFGLEVEEQAGVDITETDAAALATAKDNQKFTISVDSYASSQASISFMDKLLMVIDSKRADLGAVQNRMESTIRNQASIAENTTDARSRIRDTDFAAETANLSAQTILQQSSQTVLSQANQRPQIALSLLNAM